MLLKIWPYLTFGWPFVNISLTINPTHRKLYIYIYFCDPYNPTSNLIYMKGHLKQFENLTSTWILRDPYWEGAKSSKMWSKYFLTYNVFKPSTTHCRQNDTWVLLPLQSSISLVQLIVVKRKIDPIFYYLIIRTILNHSTGIARAT